MIRVVGRLRFVKILVLLMALVGIPLFGAPQAELWSRWEAHSSSSQVRVDHSPWDRFLSRYVDADHPSGVNRVSYSEVAASDQAKLDSYLENLQSVRVGSLNREEQMAYWINLYNAATVKLILDNYPLSSIRKIKGPWAKKLLEVEGEKVSLDDIEHRILRPIWKDNRIHYAVNCASIGCPNLQPVAFTAENLDELLNRVAREYVNHPRGARFKGNRLYASNIYQWYSADFGGSESALVGHLIEYAEPPLAQKLRGYSGGVSYAYDWSLNE